MLKRRHEDDDSDEDSVEKKIKREVEENTESSDEDMLKSPGLTVKKIIRQPQKSVNGVEKQPMPPNILIPDSQGIIRINQKQASELSSGVYIMSKTAGIIKLDSNTSKMATSGGQTIVKVAPKIGQTHIKVVKKDAASNVIRLTPKVDGSMKSKTPAGKVAIQKLPMKAVQKFTPKQFIRKKSVEPPKQPSPVEKIEFPPFEDESDGLSEPEFPVDQPIPPESPPAELTLDPVTGKIVGQEYPPDKEVVICEEKPREIYMGLVNQVKEKEVSVKEEEAPKEKTEHFKTENVSEEVAEFLSKPASTTTSTPSILQRKLLSTPARHTITKTPSRQHQPTVRTTPPTSQNKSMVRTRIVPPKQKQHVIPPTTPTITRVRHSYVNKNAVPKKIGQTTIYRTSTYGKQPKPEPAVTITKTPRRPQPQQPVKHESPTTISMPSLSSEPEPTVGAELEQISTLSVPETLAELTSLVELQDTNEAPLMLTGEDGTVYQVSTRYAKFLG